MIEWIGTIAAGLGLFFAGYNVGLFAARRDLETALKLLDDTEKLARKLTFAVRENEKQ